MVFLELLDSGRLRLEHRIGFRTVSDAQRDLPQDVQVVSGQSWIGFVEVKWHPRIFPRGVLRVERSLEETEAGLRVKEPKSESGTRSVSLSADVVATDRCPAHWACAAERDAERLALIQRTVEGAAQMTMTVKERRWRWNFCRG